MEGSGGRVLSAAEWICLRLGKLLCAYYGMWRLITSLMCWELGRTVFLLAWGGVCSWNTAFARNPRDDPPP